MTPPGRVRAQTTLLMQSPGVPVDQAGVNPELGAGAAEGLVEAHVLAALPTPPTTVLVLIPTKTKLKRENLLHPYQMIPTGEP